MFFELIAQVFYKLLYMSITALVVGLIVMLIRRFADKRFSPFWKYAMWGLVFVALLVPWRPQSSFAIMSNTESVQSVSFHENYAIAQKEYDNIVIQQSEKSAEVDSEQISQAKTKANTLRLQTLLFDVIIPVIWLSGLILFGLYMILGRLRLKSKIQKSSVAVDSDRYDIILESCKQRLGISQKVDITLQTHIKTPALFKIFRPTIILPDYVESISDVHLEYILLHELSHLRRGDHIVSALLLVLQTVYWFNPLTWFLFKFIREDMELANDSSVLRGMSKEAQKEYSISLLYALTGYRQPAFTPSLLCLVDNEKNIERRINMIQLGEFFKRRKWLIAIAAIAVIAVAATLFLTVGVSDTKIPPVYVSGEFAQTIEAAQFGYEWDFSKTNTPKVELADNINPIECDYVEDNTITINSNQELHISTQKMTNDKNYITEVNLIRVEVYNKDGSLYTGETYRKYREDGIHIQSPKNNGKYIYTVYLEFPRGYVNYGFQVIVEDTVSTQPDFFSSSVEAIESAYSNKTAYVGDNSKVGGILNSMGNPNNTTWGGMELHTSEKPYGLIASYIGDEEAHNYYSQNQSTLRQRALILLALIDNADYVKISVSNEESARQWEYSRVWAEELMGGDVREQTNNLESFKRYVKLAVINSENSEEPENTGKIAEIKEYNGLSAQALEVIYENEQFKYSLSSIRSDKIIVVFNDKSEMSLKDAIASKKATIDELLDAGLQVWIEPKDNPFNVSFSSGFYAYSIDKKPFNPSHTFFFSTSQGENAGLYFNIDELLNVLKSLGYSEKADEIHSMKVPEGFYDIIGGQEYVKDSKLETLGLSVEIDWALGRHTPVDFTFVGN